MTFLDAGTVAVPATTGVSYTAEVDGDLLYGSFDEDKADGVFDDLGKLRRGEAITVRSAHGTLRYDVTRVTSVKVGDFDKISALVYRPSGRPGLVLMTCGDWNGKRYESTTIVFSTLVAD